MYDYLQKFKYGAICFHTSIPGFSDLPDQHFDWLYEVYGNVKEEIPEEASELLGKLVQTTNYVDANLLYDLIIGRFCTHSLYLLNYRPID